MDASDMNAATVAAGIASEVRDFVTSRLRKEYPYLKTGALEQMVSKLLQGLEDDLLAQEPVMKASKANAGLLKLPAELRNQIYELVLTPHPDDIVEVQAHEQWRDAADTYMRTYTMRDGWIVQPSPTPALLAVNRQIRSEARPIYYRANTFAASFGSRLDTGFTRTAISWLKMIGPENAARIANFVVRFQEQEFGGITCATDFIKAGYTSMCRYHLGNPYFQGCVFPHSPPRKYQIIEAMELVKHGVVLDRIKVVYYKRDYGGGRSKWQGIELED